MALADAECHLPQRTGQLRARGARSPRRSSAELQLRRLGLDELEARAGVDAAGGLELALRPEGQLAVAGGAGEADAFVDELLADAAAAGGGVDDQEAELRDAVAGVDAEDRADGLAVEGGDPGVLAGGIVVLGELGDDLRDERLEARVEAVLARVEGAVALNDPAVLARERAGAGRARAPRARRASPRSWTSRASSRLRSSGVSCSSSSDDCSAARRSSSAKVVLPARVSDRSWRRPSSGERLRATAPEAERPESTRLRWPGSRSRICASSLAVVSGTCPSS